jgi:hypothetical protein
MEKRKDLAWVSVELRDGHAFHLVHVVDDGQHERLLLSRRSEACAGGWSGGEPENLAVLQAGAG